MIIEFLIHLLLGFIELLLMLLNLLPIPSWLATPLDNAVDFMMVPFGVIANYVGSTFLSGLLLLLATILVPIYGYRLAMHLYHLFRGSH